jgi:hypothetical protein
MAHSEDATITVMRYRYWHAETNAMVESQAYATSDAIHHGLGMPINESARRVQRSEIDQNGVLKHAPVEPVDKH